MGKILHLIRHGESKANRLGVYQGVSYNSHLTLKGKKQARAVAGILDGVKVDGIYSSPLYRTYETAKIIDDKVGLGIKKDKRLWEINHGSWEGKREDEFNKSEIKLLKKWRRNPVGVKMIGGEQVDDVVKRCREFVKSLNNGRYIVVTHDLVIRVIASMAIKHDFSYLWKYTLDNCGITTVSFNPFRLVCLNQNFHLNGVKSLLNRQAL